MSLFKKSGRLILDKGNLLDFLVRFSLTCISEEEAEKINLAKCMDFIDEWIEINYPNKGI